MTYYSNHQTNLKPLNLQFRQKTKNFYTKRLIREWKWSPVEIYVTGYNIVRRNLLNWFQLVRN